MKFKKIFTFSIFLSIYLPIFTFSTFSCKFVKATNKNEEKIIIKKVIDGDTVVVKLNNKDTIIRLYGVDTPEINKDNVIDKNISKLEDHYGLLAKKFLEKLLYKYGTSAIFIKQNVDKYKRLVGILKLNNIDIGKELLKNGFARKAYISINKNSYDYKFYGTKNAFQKNYYNELEQVENYAKKYQKGFWKEQDIKQIFHKWK
ncbi:thermonuclease family protein [Mycoplasmopsis lipophila]|uniref:thermonuclease family protein n=1 Tax=Mycoplasmopsis lipophila TaxID=2117 RepID=UPI003872EEFA